jgi:Uma2 family endonuclease
MVMTQAKARFATFAEYLSYSEDLDGRFQLIDGELIELPPESPENNFIANNLQFLLVMTKVASLQLIRIHSLELQTPILQLKDAANRFPDLVIIRPEHLDLMGQRLTITLDMPPPQLIAEVVSPGKINRERDFVSKRAQYAAIGVSEYWLVDPQTQSVLVLALQGSEYVEIGTFQESDRIISVTFPQLALTAAQLFPS